MLATAQPTMLMIKNGEHRAEPLGLHGLVWEIRLHQSFEVELLLQGLGARRLEFGQCDTQLLVGEFHIQGQPFKVRRARAEGTARTRHFGCLGGDRIAQCFSLVR